MIRTGTVAIPHNMRLGMYGNCHAHEDQGVVSALPEIRFHVTRQTLITNIAQCM